MTVVGGTVGDGVRIAELLSSECHGRTDGVLAHVAVVDAAASVDPTVDGTHAYDVAYAPSPLVDEHERDVDVLAVTDPSAAASDDDDDAPVAFASVFAHPERARVTFSEGVDVAVDATDGTRLRVRPTASTPPRTTVFVESGAAVKPAADVVQTVVEHLLDAESSGQRHE